MISMSYRSRDTGERASPGSDEFARERAAGDVARSPLMDASGPAVERPVTVSGGGPFGDALWIAPPRPAALPTVTECRIIQLPKIKDQRGNLTFLESNRNLQFAIRRAYWIYDVPGGERRGEHAYRTTDEFLIALSGSFEVTVEDGSTERTFTLNRSYFGLTVPAGIWRGLHNFSTNSVCLALTSAAYDPDDYIRDREQFARWRRETTERR